MSAGIDYSMGTANFDPVSGIHFGVISQNSVGQAWYDSSEPIYPETQYEDGVPLEYEGEPLGFEYSSDGYKLADCLDNDIMVLESPFYTFAKFCSPCVPGAGDLDAPDADGIKAFALGCDWFEGGVAPYTVYRVSDDSVVEAK